MSQTRDQQRFTISKVATDWHEPMIRVPLSIYMCLSSIVSEINRLICRKYAFSAFLLTLVSSESPVRGFPWDLGYEVDL